MSGKKLSNSTHAVRLRKTYYERKEKGICTRCGVEKAVPGYTTCEKCRAKSLDEQRKSTEFYIGIGICPKCRKNKIFDGERSCPECKAQSTIRWTRYISPDTKSATNLSAHERYRKRKELGLCVSCGKEKPDDGYVRCAKCREKNRKSLTKNRERKEVEKVG